jgi:hypothetical protein
VVRPEYGLLKADQRTQRATMLLEDGTVANRWEIAEAFNLEDGDRSCDSARVWLGSDPSRPLCPVPFGFAQDRLRRMDQDDNAGNKMDSRLRMSGMTKFR